MKKGLLFIFIVSLTLLSLGGCYTPEGGSSIPWNEPEHINGSLTPRVNF